MTYSSGNLILAADYNTIGWGTTGGGTYVTSPANAAVDFGVGSGRYGLGGSISSIAAVSATNTVTAAQWASLITTINNTRYFQSAGYTPISSVSTGNTISAIAALGTENTNAQTNMGLTAVSLSDSAATDISTSSAWGNVVGNRRLTFSHTLTFASNDQARYFFNAGGKIKMSFSRTGGSATTRNSNWDALLAACGTVNLGYMDTTKTGGSGTPNTIRNASNGGYWQVQGVAVSTDTLHFRQYALTAPYTIDYLDVNVKWTGTQTNGGSAVLVFTVYWENDYSNSFQQQVDGTSKTSFVISSPNATHATTYLGSSTWGTPTWSAASVTDN